MPGIPGHGVALTPGFRESGPGRQGSGPCSVPDRIHQGRSLLSYGGTDERDYGAWTDGGPEAGLRSPAVQGGAAPEAQVPGGSPVAGERPRVFLVEEDRKSVV